MNRLQSLPRVRDINWFDKKYIRAGIIPICEQGGITFFAFGIDNVVAMIGDVGGGHFEPEKDKDALDAAIREYREEALDVFGIINRDMLQDCYVLDGIDTAEILFPVAGPIYQYTDRFHKMVGTHTDYEVQNIIWFSTKQLLIAIDSQESAFDGVKLYHMYNRIHNVLHRNRHIL